MISSQLEAGKTSLCYDSGRLFIEAFTDRLFIRSYANEDFDRCLSLYGDVEITKFFDHGEPRTNEEILDYVQERGDRYFNQGEPYGIFSVFLRENNSFIGQIDLVPTDNPGEVEIGWIFHKEFQGKGFCSEAVLDFLLPFIHRIAQMGFKTGGLLVYKVIATAHPENIASNRVIQKAGLSMYQSQLRYGGKPRNWYSLHLKNPRGDK